ncbi:alpha-glucan family phosphorylase [Mucilaginibacter sp. HC2]|uniref:alpha-glucan family phosphorylase n=1 Tax=Mucilaginibacter TaxID=423349 RepID=UPI000DCC8236|nr:MULTISPECIES: alpha-glucan family phosphorylase [Mucilaginibacter]NHA05578.1 alpha-glucan family phosphorylase [Mucilaginibacter inviolabilis]QTE35386.1 alpha-glucan family phosphorylase [Mucilaginibacter gossypii]RAV59414.1 alpha-glucan family phosphorylase [Mucilaginibacter rubeus]
MITRGDIFGFAPDEKYTASVAYFSMEFAIDQALKIYSGGLGFLAGSHLRSAYELKQNLLGIGILWKYGYYDQVRDNNGLMKPEFIEKEYSFLQDTGIVFTVSVHDSPVHVKAYLLKPGTFNSAPLFLLSTDIAENDELSRSITHCLYDQNEATRIAQTIVLGIGGAMLLDILGITPDVYHMNEGHSVSLNFYLYAKYKSLEEVRKRVVFTTHTPEMAGNEAHSYSLLKEMSFFYQLQDHEAKFILGMNGDYFNYTLAALKFARKANGVSKLHGEVARRMWGDNPGICEIIAITNAQNKSYWADIQFNTAIMSGNDQSIADRKKEMKSDLFKVVADQCGKLFDENILTVVWARRFADYKRAGLIMADWDRFLKLMNNKNHPVQLIWAGKPYPEDDGSIALFNQIINQTKPFANCAVLTGYELGLSALLKKGSDVWLNNPRMYHEASGTSGMAAAMNGSINLSLPDGWVPEFAKDRENCFMIQPAPDRPSTDERDIQENKNLLDTLENILLPMYYTKQENWIAMIKTAANDIVPEFEAGRLADEYYEKMYMA